MSAFEKFANPPAIFDVGVDSLNEVVRECSQPSWESERSAQISKAQQIAADAILIFPTDS